MSLSPILKYFGSLTNINGISDPYGASFYLNQFNTVIVNMPYQINSGVITASKNLDFVNILAVANKPVWINVDLTPSVNITTSVQAVTFATNMMAFIYNQFLNYNLLKLLKGFNITHFGYELTTYSDGSILTRAQQNAIIAIAHTTYGLPIAVSSPYPSELLAVVGPNSRSTTPDTNNTLEYSALGTNPTIQDLLIVNDPLYQVSSSPLNPSLTAIPSKVLELVNLQSAIGYRNLRISCIQQIAVPDTVDGVFGLNLDATTKGNLQALANFLSICGFSSFGFSDIGYGLTTNFMLSPQMYTPQTGYYATGLATLYSNNGNIFVVYNDAVANQQGTAEFSNQYQLVGSLPNFNTSNPATIVTSSGAVLQPGEVPTGNIDGVNTIFTLQFIPYNNSLMLYANGILMQAGVSGDYTINGNTITMLAAPTIGTTLLAFYYH